jgi:microcompartment protein CcmL/EutN
VAYELPEDRSDRAVRRAKEAAAMSNAVGIVHVSAKDRATGREQAAVEGNVTAVRAALDEGELGAVRSATAEIVDDDTSTAA